MTIQAQLADGRTLEFPDGTDPSVIQATVKRMIGNAPQVQQSVNEDVPAGGTGAAFPDRPQQPEKSLGDYATGIGEAALTLGTGATGGTLGFLTGSVEGAARELVGNIEQGEGLKLAEERAAALTYAPRGEVGQDITKAIGEGLGALPPVLVAGAPSFSSGARPVRFPKSANKTLDLVGEINNDTVKKSFTKKLGEDHFSPRVFTRVKEARKQGFDDSVTTLIANASNTDKRKMARMVQIVEAGKGDARKKALTRTADVAGDALVKKIEFVRGNNDQAGKQLGRVAKGLKGEKVNVNGAINNFMNDLDELGVSFDEKGKPVFEGSQIEGVSPAESLINKIALRIKRNPTPDALEAHQFKKFIDENVAFGKSAAEGLSGKTERVVKKLRSEINESISSISDDYKQANKQFSDTITALDDLQDVAGRKLDFQGINADKAAGVLLRSQTNNTKGRANLLTAIKNLEDTAQKYGGSFDDDILNLSIMSDELDRIFGTGARTSLRGEVGKAGIDTAIDVSQMTIPGALAAGAKAGAKRLKGINEANQLKAIKELLRDSNQ
jgi:hypothetical protein